MGGKTKEATCKTQLLYSGYTFVLYSKNLTVVCYIEYVIVGKSLAHIFFVHTMAERYRTSCYRKFFN